MRIVDTHRVETLLAKDGKLLVDESYIQILTETANSKLNKTRTRMNHLKNVVSQYFT